MSTLNGKVLLDKTLPQKMENKDRCFISSRSAQYSATTNYRWELWSPCPHLLRGPKKTIKPYSEDSQPWKNALLPSASTTTRTAAALHDDKVFPDHILYFCTRFTWFSWNRCLCPFLIWQENPLGDYVIFLTNHSCWVFFNFDNYWNLFLENLMGIFNEE